VPVPRDDAAIASGRFLYPARGQGKMTIIPNLVALGLAAALNSTVPQHQIDFSMPGPDGQRLNQLWLETWINEAGVELVVQTKLTDGSYTPLIAADASRLESTVAAAQDMATTRKINLHLIKFTNRVDLEDIAP
jgi:hypothetical protein